MTSAAFDAAAERAKAFTKDPGSENKLKLYGLFKQANVGDNNTAKPGMMAFEAKYKWQAWEDNKGMSQEEAEAQYIKLVEELAPNYE
ncbi:Triakontatetraneuropeptide [Arthrobotrys entomopaga]|nr:Triakontatetraneuropeptide [Arthrobotrys entomopaga]